MALNRQAVITYVRQQPPTNFIDINRTVALISDTATFAEDYRLYTDIEAVEEDFTSGDPFYDMAEGYFNETGGNGYLYAVPVRGVTGDDDDPDIIGQLTLIENDPSLVWAVVIADETIRESAQVIDGSLAAAKYKQAYHMMFETNEAAAKTSADTDAASVNKTVYDSLSGNNSTIVGNMSFFYTSVVTDPIASKMAGVMMGQNIGSRTAKFAKPLLSTPETLTGAELQFLMDKNINVYTGTNEVTGRAFVKEGMSLKTGNFIDTSLAAIWMEVNLTAICYDLFQQKKVTIDNQGFALLENATKPVFKRAQIFGIIQPGEESYTMTFSKDETVLRGIIGTYTYNEAVAGHFLTNNVEIK
jgi:hypothetical protein